MSELNSALRRVWLIKDAGMIRLLLQSSCRAMSSRPMGQPSLATQIGVVAEAEVVFMPTQIVRVALPPHAIKRFVCVQDTS